MSYSDPEQNRAYQKQYRAKNREKAKAYQEKYKNEDREAYLAYIRAYYWNNRLKYSEKYYRKKKVESEK